MRVLEARGLSRSFGDVRAVTDLDLSLERGQIYGFLGLNGAGKTTTVRMLLGLMRPDRGTVEVFGRELSRHRTEILARVGSLVESASAYPNLTVRENLAIHASVRGSPSAEVGRTMKLLGLEEYADRKAGRLSLGNRQRLSLARALLGSPELLILDEPANGLDPAGMIEIRSLLRHLAHDQGIAVLMSSHLLDEVEQVADRVGIIHRGRLLQELDRKDLDNLGQGLMEFEVDDPDRACELIARSWPEAKAQCCGGRRGRARVPAPELARMLVGAGLDLHGLYRHRKDLETLFMELTGGAP